MKPVPVQRWMFIDAPHASSHSATYGLMRSSSLYSQSYSYLPVSGLMAQPLQPRAGSLLELTAKLRRLGQPYLHFLHGAPMLWKHLGRQS